MKVTRHSKKKSQSNIPLLYSCLIVDNSVDLDYDRKLPLHVTMLPNPSHLDAVDPVTSGKARGRQLTLKDGCYSDLPDSKMGDKVSAKNSLLIVNFFLSK